MIVNHIADHRLGVPVVTRLLRSCRCCGFAVAFILRSVLVIATVQLASDVSIALAKDPGGPGPGAETTGGGVDQATDRPMGLPSAVTQAIRGAAHYAADAWREAYRAAEEAVDAANRAIPNAAGVFRRDSNRARDAAERALEEVDEAADRPARFARVSSISPTLSLGSSQSVRRSMQAEASFARGNLLLEARKYREARDQFAEATALYPEHDQARALLAWSEYFLGDFRGAAVAFKTAVRRQPTWEGLYNGLGWSRLRLGRHHLAAEAFRSALERNPDYVDALNGLGSALFARGQYEAALRPLEKALHESRHSPGAEPPELTAMRGKMAWSLYYLDRHREALAMFIRASLAAPDSYQNQVGMGWCYLKLGQKDEARAAFQRALKLGPSDETLREGLRLVSDR
jgi:tetratricopeptide (TPR) repeat protein